MPTTINVMNSAENRTLFMIANPRIAFCITCKGRTQHLKETLPKNLLDNVDYANAVFVIVDYNSPDDFKQFVAGYQKYIDSGRVVIYSYPAADKFRMAHAKNMAHRCGILEGADILVNLDADNFTEPDFAQYIADQYATFGDDLFLWAHMIPGELPRGINGRIVITRHQFLISGGYDEKFDAWGHDDKDFNLRLRRIGFHAEQIDVRFLNAVRHNDRMRFKEYPESEPVGYYEPIDIAIDLDSNIANYGRIGMGLVYRNFDRINNWLPINLGPIPTRIFGIGMHKTATTSLYMALKTLGYDSAHWTSAHWAKAIWCEMNAMGKSQTLEKQYAFTDIPIPMLFEKLDKGYPGSKFILTTTSEEEWIKAVELHWSRKHNRFRAQWDTDPFTHSIHKILYGQRNFDREIFLARYRRHNEEVLAYFKDRPQDLLVMPMSEGAGWKELCLFLGNHVPDIPYPHGNTPINVEATQ